jgi:hypothetical protein
MDPNGETGPKPPLVGELTKPGWRPGTGAKNPRSGRPSVAALRSFMNDKAPDQEMTDCDHCGEMRAAPGIKIKMTDEHGNRLTRKQVIMETLYRLATAPMSNRGGARSGQLQAIELILAYLWGRPKQGIELTRGEDDDGSGGAAPAVGRDPMEMTSEARIVEILQIVRSAGGAHTAPDESGGSGSSAPKAAP